MEQHGPDEVITCYHLLTGEQIWTNAYPARYESPAGGVGPRTVPLIVSNRVYALGATGFLNCLDRDTGQSLWLKDVLGENSAPLPQWGVAGSPLHHDGKIIVNPGGTGGRSLVAYAAASGGLAWSGGDAPCSYGSPALMTLAGVEQILMFNQPSITSHDPATGAVLWEHPWRGDQPRVALPVAVSPDTVLFSSGYGVGAELLRVARPDSGWVVESVWRSIRMKAKFANMIRKDGFLYGLDDGILACLDLADGSQRWKEGRYGHGQLLLVGDLLLVTAENGEVVLLEPTPDAPNELSRFTAFDHKQWNPPALAGQLLLVRTHREAAAYVLPLLTEPATPAATAAAAPTATTPAPDAPDSE
jgi:outer membrane protein assembly factor BamB